MYTYICIYGKGSNTPQHIGYNAKPLGVIQLLYCFISTFLRKSACCQDMVIVLNFMIIGFIYIYIFVSACIYIYIYIYLHVDTIYHITYI